MSAAKKLIDSLKKDVKDLNQNVNSTYIKLVEVFPLQKIDSKEQHLVALGVIEKLITFINKEKSPDKGAKIYLNTLSELVSEYENSQYKTAEVTGAEMLAYLMEIKGLRQTDLAKEVGGQPIVSKILKGERELNLRQIKALAKRLKVSPQAFI